MDSGTIPVSTSDYRILLEQGLGLDISTSLPRRHIQAFRDTVPAGVSNGVVLPVNGRSGGAFNLYIGPAKTGSATFIAGLASRKNRTAISTPSLTGSPAQPPKTAPSLANTPASRARPNSPVPWMP